MKKILLTLGAITLVAAPLTMIVSCGTDSKTKKNISHKLGGRDDFMPELGSTINMTNIKNNAITTSAMSTIEKNAITTSTMSTIEDNAQNLDNRVKWQDDKGMHVLVKEKEMSVLATGVRKSPVQCWHATLDQAHLDNAKKIREYMNNSNDSQWHTYGDPIVDGINAVRLAIKESVEGNQTLKHMIRDFADNGGAISNPGNGWETDNRVPDPAKDVAFKVMAKKQVNDWFDKDKPLVIVKDIPGWSNIEGVDANKKNADSSYNKFNDPERYKMFEAPTAAKGTLDPIDKYYGALTIGTPELLTAEHRAQEDDWLGEFDGHDHAGTMKKIQDGVKTIGTGTNAHPTGELSKAPSSDEGFKGEDYMFPFTYNEHKFDEGMDFVSGLLTAINVLYDTDDGSATTGHRTNFYSESLTTIGWSRHAANSNNFQYIFTEAGKENVPKVARPDQTTSNVHPGLQLMMDPPVSTIDFNKIKAENSFMNEYSLEGLKYMSPMNFLNKINCNEAFLKGNYQNFMADRFGKDMIDELYRHHADEASFELAMQIVSPGYGDNFDFKQLTKFEEYPRFAKLQTVGRPDVFVKTYDYNGGSTITGEQYGTTPIDSTLFEY